MVWAEKETNKSMEQNRPETNPHLHGQLIHDALARIYNGKKIASSTTGAGKTEQLRVTE